MPVQRRGHLLFLRLIDQVLQITCSRVQGRRTSADSTLDIYIYMCVSGFVWVLCFCVDWLPGGRAVCRIGPYHETNVT